VATLARRGILQIGDREGVADVAARWVAAYGHLRWVQFLDLSLPDNPGEFLRRIGAAETDIAIAHERRTQALAAIDNAILDLFRIKEDLRAAIKIGPPWLAGQTVEEDEDELEA
jgi:hypothetical protein